MNSKISLFAVCVEAIVYLLLNNLLTVPLKVEWKINLVNNDQ